MNFPSIPSPELVVTPVRQKTLTFIIAFLITFPKSTLSQSSDENNSNSVTNFHPSLALMVGALCIVFSLSLLTLIYVNCCNMSSSFRLSSLHDENFGNIGETRSRFSGIDKAVIESLPYIKFSKLKGRKDGLECAICLSIFEDEEILRILPKCKHAFHIGCINQWLEKHSSCPLCRFKVTKDDITLFTNSNSLRINVSESSSPDLFIEREVSSRNGTNIYNHDHDQYQEILHNVNLVINDHDPMMLRPRWRNVSLTDLLYLKSAIITCESSNRFDHHRPCLEIEGCDMVSEGKRSVSEITIYPRFLEGEVGVEEERLSRSWLPIAKRTIEQFTSKENNYALKAQQLQIDKRSK